MLRHPGLIVVCACIVASTGCDGRPPTTPTPSSSATVRVEFGGRVVNADAGGSVGNVRVSLFALSSQAGGLGFASSDEIATSAGDGTFTLTLALPDDWRMVSLQFTAPAGYDDRRGRFEPTANPCRSAPCWAAADRPEIRMYPTLVISPGESIEVRVDEDMVWCGLLDPVSCRRVLVAASADPVELEVVARDSSKPLALALAIPEYLHILEPGDLAVRRLMVPRGGVPYLLTDFDGYLGARTATLTARR